MKLIANFLTFPISAIKTFMRYTMKNNQGANQILKSSHRFIMNYALQLVHFIYKNKAIKTTLVTHSCLSRRHLMLSHITCPNILRNSYVHYSLHKVRSHRSSYSGLLHEICPFLAQLNNSKVRSLLNEKLSGCRSTIWRPTGLWAFFLQHSTNLYDLLPHNLKN